MGPIDRNSAVSGGALRYACILEGADYAIVEAHGLRV